jgi:hypothetical protein
MDPTQEETQEESTQDIFDRIKKSLSLNSDGYTIGGSDSMYGAIPPGYGADTITVSSGDIGNFTFNNLTASSVITTNGTGGLNWANVGATSPYSISTPSNSGQIRLNGDEADIVVNGKSLMDILARLEERLNILTPNEKMEAEWDQLRELGDQYRALESKLKEQSEMWETLKKMPPPEIK